MPTFFPDLSSLHYFSLNLDLHREQFQCPQCHTAEHFLSHGFVYKKQSQGEPIAVGKRVFCSNRYQHQGCGQTQRLYLSTRVPRWHYPAIALFMFVTTLIIGHNIQQAYQRATGTTDPRQGYRWLDKLMRRIGQFRSVLNGCVPDLRVHASCASLSFANRVRRLHLLLPTMQALFALFYDDKLCACAAFQQRQQQPFA